MKKGFTLIELLAVIIILAVIALIATPIVLDVVESAKKSAFESTAYGVIDAVKLKTMEDRLEQNSLSGEYTFPNNEIEVQGKQPTGSVLVDNEGRITIALNDGKWCATKSYLEGTITVKEYVEGECELPFVMLGDVNGDGNVNSRDSGVILRYLGGREVISYTILTAGDVDLNGILNEDDAAKIRSHGVGNFVNEKIGTMVPINPNIRIEYTEVMLGDLNGDGNVDSMDSTVILRYLGGYESISYAILTAGDVDLNGILNDDDVAKILEYSSELYVNEKIGTMVPINPNIRIEYTEVKLGDVDGDRKIGASDATEILKLINGNEEPLTFKNKDVLYTICDVNQDGVINDADQTALLSYVVGSYNDSNKLVGTMVSVKTNIKVEYNAE